MRKMAMAIEKRGSVLLIVCVLILGAFIGAGMGAEPPEKYETYANGRFGYSMKYPDIFDTRTEPDNGDGVKLASKDGEYTLAMWGGYNVLDQDGYELLEMAKSNERVGHILPGSERSAENYYSIQYSDGGGKGGTEHIFYVYEIVNADMMAGFTFSYPKDEGKRFERTVIDMENSLKMPEAEVEK
jgi:hypothetical protein